MKSIRVICTKKCLRNCEGCCNKEHDLDKLPKVSSFYNYDLVILTGGEPLLFPDKLSALIKKIRKQTAIAKIIVYGSSVESLCGFAKVLAMLDGLTWTVHEKKDLRLLKHIDQYCAMVNISLRLNVFKGIELPKLKANWLIKDNIEWIKDCPIPENELSRLQRFWNY